MILLSCVMLLMLKVIPFASLRAVWSSDLGNLTLTAFHQLLTTKDSLPTTHYQLLTTHYQLLTTHYQLLTTNYSLPTTHYQLPATNFLLFSQFLGWSLLFQLHEIQKCIPLYWSIKFLSGSPFSQLDF